MPYTSQVMQGLFLVRWERPQAVDIPRMEQEVAQLVASSTRAVHGLSVVPADTTAPDEATRRAMGASLPRLLEHLTTMHVVIEGAGFAHSILRSAMTGIVLVGGKRGRVFVHSDLEAGLLKVASQLETSGAELLSALHARGFFVARTG